MSDHGYDTTDYYAIREDYGTIEDLRDLVAAAEQRGMRVILDLVINHVGADHPWFSSDDPSERRDRWFVWSDTDKGWNKPWGGDGGPHVTWFGDPQAPLDRDGDGATNDDDFFYAVFYTTMPDFNYNDPTVRDELIEQLADVMAFWIEEAGVHGFRCDAVRYIVENGPHSDQRKDQPETHALWKTLRARLAEIDPEAILLAEAPTEEYDQMLAYYGEGDEFHSAFHFKLPWVLLHTIDSGRRPAHLLGDLYAIQANLPPRTQDTIFLSNHDQFAGDRVASQLGEDPAKIRAAAALYLLLSGNPAIYYGEEIGMTGSGSDAAIRGPMDFAAADAQRQDPGSLLNHYTRLLRIRDRYDALRGGISYFVPSRTTGWDCAACESDRLALIREYFGEKVLVIHNFAPGAQALHLDLSAQATGLEIPDGTGVHGLMGGGTFAPITGANRQLYPVGTIPGRGTRVLFLGDIESYRQADGTLLTYENAVGGPIPPPARIQVAFRCQNGVDRRRPTIYASANGPTPSAAASTCPGPWPGPDRLPDLDRDDRAAGEQLRRMEVHHPRRAGQPADCSPLAARSEQPGLHPGHRHGLDDRALLSAARVGNGLPSEASRNTGLAIATTPGPVGAIPMLCESTTSPRHLYLALRREVGVPGGVDPAAGAVGLELQLAQETPHRVGRDGLHDAPLRAPPWRATPGSNG